MKRSMIAEVRDGLHLLLATLRRRPAPRRVSGLTGLVTAGGVFGCAGTSVVMNLLNPAQAGAMLTNRPAVVLVAVVSAVLSVLVTRSAVRSLRAARATAGSDQGADPQVG